MSGGKGGGESVNTDPWVGQQPYLKTGFQQAQNLLNAGGPQYYPGQTYTPFSPQMQQALGLMGQRSGGSPVESAMQGYVTNSLAQNNQFSPGIQSLLDTSGGSFLNANPYLDQMFGQASRAVSDQWKDTVMPGINASFAGAGGANSGIERELAFDSARTLGDTLGGLATNIYGGNYANERGLMMDASSQLGDLYSRNQGLAATLAPTAAGLDWQNLDRLYQAGALGREDQMGALQSDIDRWNYQQNQPYDNLARYMQNIGGGYGSQSTTQAQSGSQLMGALGGGLAGAGLASSIWNTPFAGTPWGWGLTGLGALAGLL